jgi:hypothetical protein
MPHTLVRQNPLIASLPPATVSTEEQRWEMISPETYGSMQPEREYAETLFNRLLRDLIETAYCGAFWTVPSEKTLIEELSDACQLKELHIFPGYCVHQERKPSQIAAHGLKIEMHYKPGKWKAKHVLERYSQPHARKQKYPPHFQAALKDIKALKDGWGGENEPAPSMDTLRRVLAAVDYVINWCKELKHEPIYPDLIPGFLGQIELSYSLETKDLLVEVPGEDSLRMRVLLGFKDGKGNLLDVKTKATHSLSEIRPFLEQFIGQ